MPDDAHSDNVTAESYPVERRGAFRVLPPLTEKQAQCLEFIHSFFEEHRYYPTQREIAQGMKLQSSTAEIYLEPLRKKGYLHRRVRRQRRNIRLTPKARQKLELKIERPEAA